ncbi:MAG: hypothetical protein ACK5AZ_11815 [Bryobacteraceae bacterium]
MPTARFGRMLAALTLLLALLLHARIVSAVLDSDLAAADPPAHFVTGVMVYDYLQRALGADPVKFAESYYAAYPKVAFGHWPPTYYGLQALWYLAVPPAPVSARILSGLIAAGLALVLFYRLWIRFGGTVAVAACAIFLSIPMIQSASWEVMSDLLTGFFIFLALFAFSNLLQGEKPRSAALRFTLWASLAILTKGSAWALGIFVFAAPLLARRIEIFRNRWYWISGAGMVLFATPFYLVTKKLGLGYPGRMYDLGPNLSEKLIAFHMFMEAGTAVVCIMALIGFAVALRRRWLGQDQSAATSDALVAGAYILSQIVFLTKFPLTLESRVMIPLLAPAVLLASHSSVALGRALANLTRAAAAAPALLALVCLVNSGAASIRTLHGYGAAVEAIPYGTEPSVILVGSGARGEGAMIAERLARDSSRASVMLRSSRFLAQSRWSGDGYRLLFPDAGSAREHLLSVPVQYIVVDETAMEFPHVKLLADAVRGDPETFALIARRPVLEIRKPAHALWSDDDSQREHAGDLLIYENRLTGHIRPSLVEVQTGLDRGGRVFRLKLR